MDYMNMNGNPMGGSPTQPDPQQYDKNFGELKTMRNTVGVNQGIPFSQPNLGKPLVNTFLPHPNWAPSVEGDSAIGTATSFNVLGSGGMMPSQQEMQAMSSPFQTPAMSVNATRLLHQDMREEKEARRGRAVTSSPSRSPDGLRSTRGAAIPKTFPHALGPVLRRLEEIEIKNQRDREQLNVWKETQEVGLRKLEIQMGQLMRAVHSLIHISQTAIDNRVHRDEERGEHAARAYTDEGDRVRQARKVETSLIATDKKLQEARTTMTKPANPFEASETGSAEVPIEQASREPGDVNSSPQQATPNIIITSPRTPASPQEASPIVSATVVTEPSKPESQPGSPQIPQASASVVTTTPVLPATVVFDWDIKATEWTRYRDVFIRQDTDKDGYVDAPQLLALVTRSKIPRQQLVNIIALCDLDRDGRFTEEEFILATHMVTKVRQGFEIPTSLPPVLRTAAEEKKSKRAEAEAEET